MGRIIPYIVAEDDALAAGDFSSWLAGMQAALAGTLDSDVPCGSCTACCTSSQFVHIGPDEKDALAHIPPALLFPAPGMPRGHVVLGYDERGHCPMLVDGRCSIYAHRPRTCRTYDCRIFPATGVQVDKPLVSGQSARWRFESDGAASAVRAAADFLEKHAPAPMSPTRRAVRAVEIHHLFLDGAEPDPDPTFWLQ
jgi:Fe-S-cluster containining protein